MPQNFSLDDILAEIDAKKTESSAPSGSKPSGAPKKDYSVTSIINSDELKAAAGVSEKKPVRAKSEDYSVTAIIDNGELKKKAKEKDIGRDKPVENDRPAEKKPRLIDRTARIVFPQFEEKSESSEEIGDAREDAPKPALFKKQEYDTEEQKLIDSQLRADDDFEDPDDLIDAINPYEVKSKAADLSAVLGGDTLGIAGNDLKQIAEASHRERVTLTDDGVRLYGGERADVMNTRRVDIDESAADKYYPSDRNERLNAVTLETTAPVKKYVPQKDKEEKNQNQPPRRQTEKERRSNDALLEKLNLALSRKRAEEEEKKRTMGLSVSGGRKSEVLRAPTGGLNLDGEKVIMATGVIPEADTIKEKSKRKLRDFVMENNEEEEEKKEDFDSYDSTGQIWADLCESHKVIKIRFFILFVLTVFMFFVALMGDMNNGMVFDFFGFDVAFLDRRADAQGFLFYNLILGVISAALCSSVLYNGIVKLFRLKADCDSVCAVTATMAIIANAINIVRSDDIILSRAYVYIPVAIAGLMFNTLGKLMMVTRAKRNFRFISGDTAKYSAVMVENDSAAALTKGVAGELPCLAAMRKTELLTDFLKSSYCEDRADRLSNMVAPIAVGVSVLSALIAFLIPYGTDGLRGNIYWALTVLTAVLSLMTPFAMMFMVNVPLTRAGRELAKSESVVLGCEAAEEFSETNAVMVDASLLFPAGTIIYSNIKHCKQPNSINNIALDQAIILAASLAIKSGSAMSNMFKDMINDKDDILVKVENCVYEDNLGILGWFGNKRMIMGSREQMKHHDIKVPDMKKVKRYARDATETIYLSVAGEVVIMFFVELKANPNIKACLQQLAENGVSIVVKTTDSIITVAKIAEVFEIPPERIKILPYSMHELFNVFTRYTSRGSGAVSCNGTFSGFANAILAAKRLVKDINLGMYVMLGGGLIGTVAALSAAFTGNTQLLAPSLIIGWNILCMAAMIIAQCIRRY